MVNIMNLAENLPAPTGVLGRLSRCVACAEIAVGAVLVASILCLMIAGMVARGMGAPLIWSDELAVAAMVWLAFIGGSLAIATGMHMVMGLLPETLAPPKVYWVSLLNNLLVLAFLLVSALVIWNWLDLPGLLAAGSGQAYAEKSFNFLYTDPTLTLGVRKIWFWMILPISTICGVIHCLALISKDIRNLAGASE